MSTGDGVLTKNGEVVALQQREHSVGGRVEARRLS
jgi:hypothetical protein